MSRPVFVVNLKNYGEIMGEPAVRLCRAAERISREVGVDLMVAPPAPSLAIIATSVEIPVLGQNVQDAAEGKSTGAVIPEALKAWGCAGSIINHSESRARPDALARLVPRMKALGLVSCVCSETPGEVERLSKLGPEYIAVEPPELIGTGVSVSKARPELISESVERAAGAGYRGTVLCGAGIVSGEDVRKAVELGAGGILVASSVVKAADWAGKIRELASALL